MRFQGTCDCGRTFRFRLPETCGPGFLQCPECGQLITKIDVSGWSEWIKATVQMKERELRDRSYPRVDREEVSADGLGAELAACLCFCPAAYRRWTESALALVRNTGHDLLGHWVGHGKHFEIKWTKHYSKRPGRERGVLYIRRPATESDLVPARDVLDSIYVLFHGVNYSYFANCWADRESLLARGELNPKLLPSDGETTWGGLWTRFNPIATTVDSLGLRPTSLPIESSAPAPPATTPPNLDLSAKANSQPNERANRRVRSNYRNTGQAIRLYALARELKLEAHVLVLAAKQLGFKLRSQFSIVTPEQRAALEKHFRAV